MPLHPSTTVHDFLNNQWIRNDIVGLWRSAEDVPAPIRANMSAAVGDPRRTFDYATPIDKGKDWLFEFTCKFQPRTGAMIMKGGPLMVRVEEGAGTHHFIMAVEVNGKMIQFHRDFWGSNPSDGSCEGVVRDDFGYEKSLPDGLGEAYYTRFTGMNLMPEPYVSIYSYALPKDRLNWKSVEYYMDYFQPIKGEQLGWFFERFPQYALLDDSGNSLHYQFSCWLDTRLARNLIRDLTPEEERARAMNYPVDALFVRQDIVNSPIYHVVDGKLDQMRVLNNPAEAVDLYCEHVLLGCEERFDFIEHGRPLD